MKNRWLIAALALVAASAFAVSVQAGRWWVIEDTAIGPFGTRGGPLDGATTLSWTGGSPRWQRFAIATWTGGLIAMFVFVVLAGAVAARRVPRLAAQTALVATATAGLAAIGFVLGRPDELPFVVGRGLPLFVVAVTAGVVAAIAVLRTPRTG